MANKYGPNYSEQRLSSALAAGAQAGPQLLSGLLKGREAEKDREVKLRSLLQRQAQPREGEFKAAGFAKRAQQAEDELGRVLGEGFDPTSIGTAARGAIPSLGGFGDWLKGQVPGGDQQKQFEQAQRNFVSAVLRKESGAAIGKHEYASEVAKYFPQPGDDPQTIAQKQAARAQAVQNLLAEGGRAAGRIPEIGASQPKQRSQNEAARKWLKANPKHPKAAAVRKKLGL